MSYRWPASVGIVLTAVYVLVYVRVVDEQADGTVAWWYVGALVVAAVALASAAVGRLVRPALVTALVLLALATLIGALTIGVALLPAVAAAVVALVLASRRPARLAALPH